MGRSPAIARTRSRRPAAGGDIEQAACDAAERLLAGRRFADISVADIIGEAGVSRASFYFYFGSKYELLTAVSGRVVDEVYDATRTWLQRADGEPPEAALRTSMQGALAGWRRHGPVLRAVVEAAPNSPEIDAAWQRLIGRFTDGAAAQIERERAAGVAPAGIDARTLAAMLTWMTERALYLVISDAEPQFTDDARLVETLTGVWWRAIYGAGPDATGASSGLVQSR